MRRMNGRRKCGKISLEFERKVANFTVRELAIKNLGGPRERCVASSEKGVPHLAPPFQLLSGRFVMNHPERVFRLLRCGKLLELVPVTFVHDDAVALQPT